MKPRRAWQARHIWHIWQARHVWRAMAGPLALSFRRVHRSLIEFLGHIRRRWYLYLPIAAIWVLALVRVFIDPTPRIPILFNWSASLPYRVALVRYGSSDLARGDHVVYAFDGQAIGTHPGLRGQPFFKRIAGVPGDVVSVTGRVVAINGQVIGSAKTQTFDRKPLDPISGTVIPSAHYFVQGVGPDSFDSRYRQSGLVRAEQIVAIVVPLL